jgi:alkylation response protein AidB-like acyl-CoA dehydrogenase
VLDDLDALAEGRVERRELSALRGEAQAARLHGRRAVELLDAGRPAAAASSMAKLSIALLARRTAELGSRVLGPDALLESDPAAPAAGRIAALGRACAGSTVAGGAAEIQRRVIARMGLGCPA